uniref:Uncharacterized protein n=1 Tax=Glossina palpalis gambiensis TaxID=67801 RepID=A0A1B0BT77_9MUSC
MVAVYLNDMNTLHMGQQRGFLRVSHLKFSIVSTSQHPLLDEYDDIFTMLYRFTKNTLHLGLTYSNLKVKVYIAQFKTAGGSMLGDVNISAILDSFSVSYDKRVRPNYGGKSNNLF